MVDYPPPITKEFAYSPSADKIEPPLTDSDVTIMTQELGYPPAQSIPLTGGGTPVDRAQTNGAFNLYSKFINYTQAGGMYTFDARAGGIGNNTTLPYGPGYDNGTVLWDAVGKRLVMSTEDGNFNNFVDDATQIGAGKPWVPITFSNLLDLQDLWDNTTAQQINIEHTNPTTGARTPADLAITGHASVVSVNNLPTAIPNIDYIKNDIYPDIVDNPGVSVTITKPTNIIKGLNVSNSGANSLFISNTGQVATTNFLDPQGIVNVAALTGYTPKVVAIDTVVLEVSTSAANLIQATVLCGDCTFVMLTLVGVQQFASGVSYEIISGGFIAYARLAADRWPTNQYIAYVAYR